MNKSVKSVLGLVMSISVMFVASIPATYATSCTGLGNISTAESCENGVGPTDHDWVLNNEEFFGHNDWVELSKYEVGSGFSPNNGTFEITMNSDLLAGTWKLMSSIWSSYEDIVIVMKPANEWGAWLLDSTKSENGNWSILTGKELSHFTVYARTGSSSVVVPEPSSFLLLSLGLAGFWFARKGKTA